MESKNENQNQTDAEILAELKRLNAIMTKRRRTPKPKEPIDKTENNENSEVKRRGRPIAEWRHGEDGKYNKQAIDPEYSTQYWRENFRKPFICPICETSLKTVGSNVLKHQRTLHCQLTKYKKEQAAIN
jgi:hypothetical protein